MTDGDALYRAIVARPEDDTPRLVYADWLEENGHEEEAEFIRVECKLDGSNPDIQGFTDLLHREEELQLWLQTHVPKQIPIPKRIEGGLKFSLGRNWWERTSRGFPDCLTISHRGDRLGTKRVKQLAAALEKTFARIPTRSVSIDFAVLEDLAEFLKQPVVSALEGLTVGTNELAGDDSASLIADCRLLSNLRRASFRFPIEEAGAGLLGRSEYLGKMEILVIESGNLTGPAIRALGTGAWFRGLNALVFSNQLATEAFEELCQLSRFPHLSALEVHDSSFPISSWHAFARSKIFPALSWLGMTQTDMSSGQMDALAAANGVNLSYLDLERCSIGNDGVRSLIAAPWATSLQRLDLTHNRLGPSAAQTIAKCRKFSKLTHLALAGNSIAGSGIKAIAGSPHLRNLKTLTLGNFPTAPRTSISEACHTFIKNLDMPNLHHLSLSDLPLNAKSVRLFTEEKFRSLTRLALANCKLTDERIPELLRSPALQGLIELNLKGNAIKTGVQALTDRRVLPRLSMCTLTDNPIPPELTRKLVRRRGVVVSQK